MPPPISAEAVENKLKSFIAGRSGLVTSSEIDRDTKILSSGLLDSLAFVELIMFIETEFKIRLSETTEVNIKTMDSMGQIIQTVLTALDKR